MKKVLIAGLIAVATGTAYAAPHDFQRQMGSSELDPSIWEGPLMTFTPITASASKSSLEVLYATRNIDGAGEFDFTGTIVASGPTRISLYEAQRGSPEATAYRDYYERHPMGFDWEAIARTHHDRNGDT